MFFFLCYGLFCFDWVLIIGGDVYLLILDYFNQVLSVLQEIDVVLGLVEDGGYVLVGVMQIWFVLFQKVFWGMADVMGMMLDIMLVNGIGFYFLLE